jgi:hypothetical protein
MIINQNDYYNIDYKKYNRIFIFGCSFTHYAWPTWANVISYHAPHATTYNFARSGGGNMFIAERVVAVNQAHKFCETDLILIMWSTHSREDRYIVDQWHLPGNIFTQGFYSDEFVKKYSCVKGYLVRDLALITLTNTCLESYSSDSVVLRSVYPDFDHKFFNGNNLEEVIELYQDISNSMPIPLQQCVLAEDGTGWINGHEYYWPNLNRTDDSPFLDYHPNPLMYMQYLQRIGFNISESVQQQIIQLTTELKLLKDRKSIEQWFMSIVSQTEKYLHYPKLLDSGSYPKCQGPRFKSKD